MIRTFNIIGDLTENKISEIDISKSPLDILAQLNIGMRNNSKIIGVQIGGALGDIAFGNQMLEPIENRLNDKTADYIMFIGEQFCPVDYLRFLSRFLIREVRIESDQARYLNSCIEDITLKETKHNSIDRLKQALAQLSNTYAEIRVSELYYQIIDRFEEVILEHINDKFCATSICRTLFIAQCVNACPAHVHIPGYVALMKQGKEETAYHLMRKTNPLSLICGKICARPCEQRCRRKEIENTVGVRALQKYISLNALTNGNFVEDKAEPNGKTIGIIGAGPAGLTAAYFLQRTGYQVEVYEQLEKAGGMLASCVPSYRMPDGDLDLEISSIVALGVNIHYRCAVGKDITIGKLKAKHDAVIIAIGAQFGRELKSLSSENTVTAVDFLKDVRINGKKDVPENVVVLGGGDVAIDSARTAVRLGAKSVTVVSLETFEQMPANYEEKDFAIKENIKFEDGYSIKEFNDNGVSLVKCHAVTDLDGRFAPILSDQVSKQIKADFLITAVGQRSDLSLLPDDINIKNGLIQVDKTSFETSCKGIYAVGDVVKNGIAIRAIAEGKSVAEKVDEDLRGVGLYVGEPIEIPEMPLSIKTWDDEICQEKNLSPASLKDNFEELVQPFNQNEALYEANRCMRCDRNSIQPLWIRPKNI